MFDVTTQGRPTGVRGKLGRIAHHLVPDLDQRVYARDRSADRRNRRTQGGHEEVFAAANSAAFPVETNEPVIVVVPPDGYSTGTWEPAQWNIYFEASQRLRETHGPHRVIDFFVEPGELSATWQKRLIDFINDAKATHLLTHIERDPETSQGEWTWDTFWEAVSPRWPGVLLGGMFDSSYRFTEAKGKILAKMSPNFVLVDICIPMDGSMARGQPEVGPVNIPMSEATLQLVDSYLADQEKEFDISFMGVLYDYRVELVEKLRASGISVAVNPHRQDSAMNADATRQDQPSWLDYMRGLAASRATINFSRSNAGPFEQLKTRVVEVGLAGTYLFTDDHDRTRLFWNESDFSTFDSPQELNDESQRILGDPEELLRATNAFRDRARFLARNQYWRSIETTLQARGLPSLGIEPFTG